MPSPIKKIIFVAGIALWVTGVAWGMKWMTDYSFTPGEAGTPATSWPGAEIGRGSGRFTLVVGLHPECPCSQATLDELDRILLEAGDSLDVIVVFDDTVPTVPVRSSSLYQRAAQLPRTRLVCLTSAAELQRFDFRTSGETRLYRPDGKLAFRGGITASRGHVGDNPGATAVVRYTRAELCGTTATPAFGCALTPGKNVSR